MRGLAAALVLALGAAPIVAADAPRVLFDEAHGQRFHVGRDGELDLSQLGAIVRRAGARFETSTAAFSEDTLTPATAVVVSGAFAPVAASERDALLGFLDRGGRLAIMLHIGPPVADLLRALGISISNGVVRESDGVLHGDPIDFRVSRLARHPLTTGLSGFALYGAWALLPEAPRLVALAETQPHAWVDLNRSERFDTGDAMQSFVVAVVGEKGEGHFVVFGDDALFQNRFLAEGKENLRLAQNLAAWLLGRDPAASLAAAKGQLAPRAAR